MIIDKTKIGRLKAIGGEHLVYYYCRDQVIKKPNFLAKLLFNNRKLAEKKEADFILAKKYFNDYLIPTECLLPDNNREPYYLIQPLAELRPFVISDLNDPELSRQFQAIREINKKIKAEYNLSFDFYGAWRLLFYEVLPGHKINNLMVTPDQKIIIVDVVFLENGGCQWSYLLTLISRWANTRQEKLLNKLKKYERD